MADRESTSDPPRFQLPLPQLIAGRSLVATSQAQLSSSSWTLREAGLIEGDRHACRKRWQDTADTARRVEEIESAAARDAESAYDATVIEAEKADQRMVSLRAVADRLNAELTTFDRDLAAIVADGTAQTLLPAPPADVLDVARLAELAERAAGEADLRAAGHERLAAVATTELAHLDETGTAPTGPDVLSVLAVLVDARIGAVGGLEWVERNIIDPSARSEFIRTNAEVAGGVIVSDPNRFEAAIDTLSNASLHTRTPVTIATSPDGLYATPAQIADRYTILPHRSTWDRQWAAEYREQLQSQAAAQGEAARNARSAASLHRKTEAKSVRFAQQWQATSRPQLNEQATASASKVTEALRQREEIRQTGASYREAAAQHRDRAAEARAEADNTRQHTRQADDLVKITDEAETAAAERPATETARTAADDLRHKAELRRAAAASEINQQTNAAAVARAARREFERERRDISVEAAGPDPAATSRSSAAPEPHCAPSCPRPSATWSKPSTLSEHDAPWPTRVNGSDASTSRLSSVRNSWPELSSRHRARPFRKLNTAPTATPRTCSGASSRRTRPRTGHQGGTRRRTAVGRSTEPH